jgi:hypothetical protein
MTVGNQEPFDFTTDHGVHFSPHNPFGRLNGDSFAGCGSPDVNEHLKLRVQRSNHDIGSANLKPAIVQQITEVV